jgi:hypothetical protein
VQRELDCTPPGVRKLELGGHRFIEVKAPLDLAQARALSQSRTRGVSV